jgi:homocysteine S-methyltransferase
VYKNLAQYPQETPLNFQTQVVYDVDKAITFSEKAKSLGKPLLMGIVPLKSVKMAWYMKDQVEGIDIPDEIIFSMEKEGKTAIDIACNIIGDIYQYIDGIHIMALGDAKDTNQIIEFVRKLVADS